MRLTILIIFISIGTLADAQIINPVKWEFKSRKIADKTYEVHLKAEIEQPWHLYSQFTPEGGPVPTNIIFSNNPLVTITAKIKEEGKLITKREDVFDMNVKYFNGEVDFVQTIQLKTNVKTKINGTIKYMVCNDVQCLAPKTIPFAIQ